MFEMLILLFACHWIGDFIFQTRYIADNKGKNNYVLTLHVFIYTLTLFVGICAYTAIRQDFFGVHPSYDRWDVSIFLVANFVLHWITDFTTSRITKYFWAKQDIHKFFATIGFDQMLHQICLLVTLRTML